MGVDYIEKRGHKVIIHADHIDRQMGVTPLPDTENVDSKYLQCPF